MLLLTNLPKFLMNHVISIFKKINLAVFKILENIKIHQTNNFNYEAIKPIKLYQN